MKPCRKCGEVKPLTAFYKHRQMLDGYLHTCKVCSRKAAKQNRDSKLDYYQAVDRLRQYEGGDRRVSPRKHQPPNRQKQTVRMAVHRAIATGKLRRPERCTQCRQSKTVQAHHSDYGRPLEVEWLCQQCHGRVHRRHSIDEARARVAKGNHDRP